MKYKFYLSNKALKFLKRADAKLKERMLQVFRMLEIVPVPAKELDVLKVEGERDVYRIRIGSFRIVYRVKWQQGEVEILRIERKSETTYK